MDGAGRIKSVISVKVIEWDSGGFPALKWKCVIRGVFKTKWEFSFFL